MSETPEMLIVIVRFPQDENGEFDEEPFGPFESTEERDQWMEAMIPLWPLATFVLTELVRPKVALDWKESRTALAKYKGSGPQA